MKLFFKIILFVGLTHVALSMRGGAGGDSLHPGTSLPSETTFNAGEEKTKLIQLLTPPEGTATTEERKNNHDAIKDYLNNHIQKITTNSRNKKKTGHTPNPWNSEELKAIFADDTVKVAAQAYQDHPHMTLPKIHFRALTNFNPTEGCSQCREEGDGQDSTTGTDGTLEHANGDVSPTTSIGGSSTDTDGSTLEQANGGGVSSVGSSSPTTSTGGIGGVTGQEENGDGDQDSTNDSSGACCTVS